MNRINIEYGKWLNQMNWSYFCTFTTDYKMTLESARRAMARFFERISECFQKSRVFWVAEPFKVKDGCHIHALVYLEKACAQNAPNSFKTLKTAWKNVSGGNKKNYDVIKVYDKHLGANYYVTKSLQNDNYGFYGEEYS